MLYIFINSSLGYLGPIWPKISELPTIVNVLTILVAMLGAYLLGSINTAIVVSTTMYKDDIRKHGSGNAGFTNVMRTYGTKAAAITFAGDILKTVLAIMLGWLFRGYFGAYLGALACFFGHLFPVFYQFKGGKGVLCTAASLLMLDWRMFLILVALFVAIVAMSKYISLGSTIGVMVYPLLTNRLYAQNMEEFGWIANIVAVIIAVFVVIKHIPNLKRISKGEESKFKFKKSEKAKDSDK